VTRCPYWSSAVAAALVLAGCGARSGPFADARGPLHYVDEVVASDAQLRVHDIAFIGASGRTVYGYLATPRSAGRHPAVLFLHGAGGTAADFLQWAEALASEGVVGMTIQQPNDAPDYAPLVVNARRALDALQRLPDVDGRRLGVLGLSLGAQTAAILAGVDHRIAAASLASCRGTPTVLAEVGHAHARFLVEAGRHDQVVPRSQLRALIRAVPQPKLVRWFDASHLLTYRAFSGQLVWLRAQLRRAR
jgi:dienelactone hydrolase